MRIKKIVREIGRMMTELLITGKESNNGVEFGEEDRVEVSEDEGRERGLDEVGKDEGKERGPPMWMQDYVIGEGLSEYEANMALVMSANPVCFKKAIKNENWRLAMDCEINFIEKNKTWTLNELPAGAKTIGVKRVYKTKYNEHGDIDKHKAKLVAKGYSQKHGIDYTVVFTPGARLDTIRMIIALAAQKSWKIFQLDV